MMLQASARTSCVGCSSSASSSAAGRSSAVLASSNTAPMRTPMNGASGSGAKYRVYFSRSSSLAMPSRVAISAAASVIVRSLPSSGTQRTAAAASATGASENASFGTKASSTAATAAVSPQTSHTVT